MKAVRKLLTLILNTGVTKLLGLATHFFVAGILTHEDFGIYAIVVTISAFLLTLRNGGVQQYLMHHIGEIKDLIPSGYRFGLTFNVISMLLLAGSAPLIAGYYHEGILADLLLILAASIPMSTPWFIYRAELLSKNRYDLVSNATVISDIVKYSTTICLVAAGFGLYGLVIPSILEGILLTLMGWRMIGYWIPLKTVDRSRFGAIFSSTKWIMLSSFAIALTKQGDYFSLSLFANKADLGLYYFSYQLVFSVIIFFITINEFVLVPLFAKSKLDSYRLSGLFHTVLTLSSMISIAIGIFFFAYMEGLVAFIWKGKWDAAVPLAKIMLPLILFLNIFYITRALADALGMWKSRLWFNLTNGAGIVAITGASAVNGGIAEVTLNVVCFQAAFAILQLLWISHMAAIRKSQTFLVLLNLAMPAGLAFAVSTLNILPVLEESDWAFYLSVYILTFFIINRTVTRSVAITGTKIKQIFAAIS